MANNRFDGHGSNDFFEESPLDPMTAVTGPESGTGQRPDSQSSAGPKQKAGFYLSKQVLSRFNRKFYELKMEGKAVGNKSALLEAALEYALDDIDRGAGSEILAVFDNPLKS